MCAYEDLKTSVCIKKNKFLCFSNDSLITNYIEEKMFAHPLEI